MSVPELSELAVEILHRWDDGGRTRWSVGSGFIVGDALVLTAAHNVGPGELLVRAGDVERPAVVRLRGDESLADLALLQLTSPLAEGVPQRAWMFGEVDASTPAVVEECWAVGFPRFKERIAAPGKQGTPQRPVRSSAHVTGRIPAGEYLGRRLLSLQVDHAPLPLAGNESQWEGMSGAVVFAGDVVAGVVSEHHRPEGSSSLTVTPITAIDLLPDAAEWWHLLRVHRPELVRLPLPEGLYLWTAADFAAGLQVGDERDNIAPIESGEPVTAAMLRQGRLPNLQRHCARLASAFDLWLRREAWAEKKRGDEPLRVFWLEGDWGPERSKGRLACMARAQAHERAVYDVMDWELGATVLQRNILTTGFAAPPLISVDLLPGEEADLWRTVRTAMLTARNRFTDSGGDPYPRILVAGTRAQAEAANKALSGVAHIETYNRQGFPQARAYSYSGLASMASESLTDDDIYNRGLPVTTRNLVGREEEIEELDNAWSSRQIKVFSVVAQGGAGKSALVNEWLRRMRDDDYRGARKVFAWSFYSQGTRENLVSADLFISAALTWLGVEEGAISLNPHRKGLQLAALIKQHRFLFVLDGMEPLQYPLQTRHVGGNFTDQSIVALLEELAKPDDWRGLCLVTTRVPMTDLRRFQQDSPDPPDIPTVGHRDLENLTISDGAVLLRSLIETGDKKEEKNKTPQRELEKAVREVDGHALAITLLGNYVRDVHQGNLAGRFDLQDLTVSAREGGHARRIMASYASWLKRHEQEAELAILNLIGLFDRPAAPEAMNALLADASMAPFTGQLHRVDDPAWDAASGALREMGLLNRPMADSPGTLDAHPLVREHFRDEARTNTPNVWIRGNRALFDFYQAEAPERPSTSGQMNPLYAAVTHGCAAQLHQKVYDDVLLPRVWRTRRTNFSTRRLGMTGSDLAALSNYFHNQQWTEIRTADLLPRARVLILTNAGVRLRQLGRLVNARECFGAVAGEINAAAAEPEELEDASYAAAQNCELLVIAGRLTGRPGEPAEESNSALISAQRAIEYADGGGDPYFKMHSRSTMGEVHFMLGDFPAAQAFFQEAIAIDRDQHPDPTFLYSQGLFRYGYFLIETGQAARVLDDESRDPSWGRNGDDSSLLSEAIRLLVVGAAHRALVWEGRRDADFLATAESILDQAIDAFKLAGYADYTVRGLLERANFYWVHGGAEYYRKSLKDLDDATVEADRGQMELLYADILLQRIACYMRYWPTMTSPQRERICPDLRKSLKDVKKMLGTMSYWRRKTMLADLEERAQAAGVPTFCEDPLRKSELYLADCATRQMLPGVLARVVHLSFLV
jgi:tetratricopeptide (TPR) repeat protein